MIFMLLMLLMSSGGLLSHSETNHSTVEQIDGVSKFDSTCQPPDVQIHYKLA